MVSSLSHEAMQLCHGSWSHFVSRRIPHSSKKVAYLKRDFGWPFRVNDTRLNSFLLHLTDMRTISWSSKARSLQILWPRCVFYIHDISSRPSNLWCYRTSACILVAWVASPNSQVLSSVWGFFLPCNTVLQLLCGTFLPSAAGLQLPGHSILNDWSFSCLSRNAQEKTWRLTLCRRLRRSCSLRWRKRISSWCVSTMSPLLSLLLAPFITSDYLLTLVTVQQNNNWHKLLPPQTHITTITANFYLRF